MFDFESGATSFTVTVRSTDSDDLSIEETFTIEVLNVNEAPVLTLASESILAIAGETATNVATVSDVDTDVAALSVTASSGNTLLIPAGNITVEGSGADRTISVTPRPGLSGTATVTVRVSDGLNSVRETFTVQVNGNPELELGNLGTLFFCAGDNEPVSVDIAPYLTSDDEFTVGLSSDNAAIEVSAEGTVVTIVNNATEATTAEVTVTVTDAIGQTVSDVFSVVVNGLPTTGFSNNADEVCSTAVTLRSDEAVIAGAARILWTIGDDELEGKNIVYDFGGEGTYSVTQTVISSAGCVSELTATVSVSAPFNPVVTITKTVNGDTGATLSIDGTFATIQWYGPGGLIDGANGTSFDATANGTYYVVVGNDRGCVKRSGNVTVTNVANGDGPIDPNPDPVGLPEDISEMVRVYPNPAVGVSQVGIRMSNEQTGSVRIIVSDMTGRQLQVVDTDKSGREFSYGLEVSQLPSGTYLIQLQLGNSLAVKRLVIE
jgi:hypothetical protein